MVDSLPKLHCLHDVFHNDSWLLSLHYVVFITLRMGCSKLSLKHIWKGVRYLIFAGKDSPDKSRPWDGYGIDWSKVSRIKAGLHERLDIKLQIEPDTLEDHCRRNSRVHWSPRDIVFAIGILLPRKEYEPLLLLILIAEGNLDVELLLVKHFDLHVQERLQKVQLSAPVVFWQLQLRA